MSHDQCECQRQVTVKTRAAKLLVTLVRSLDGALTQIVSFVSQTMDYKLTSDYWQYSDSEESKEETYFESQKVISMFLNLNKELTIDICLLALCILHESIKRREDIFKQVLKMLKRHLYEILSKRSVIIKLRLSLLLKYYMDSSHFYHSGSEAFAMLVDFLFESILFQGEERVIAISSIETLNSVLECNNPQAVQRLAALVDRGVHQVLAGIL